MVEWVKEQQPDALSFSAAFAPQYNDEGYPATLINLVIKHPAGELQYGNFYDAEADEYDFDTDIESRRLYNLSNLIERDIEDLLGGSDDEGLIERFEFSMTEAPQEIILWVKEETTDVPATD